MFTRTRFAPAPTGYLHLGHVANALYVWGLGRARGARVLLRIEDHDRDRSRPAFETALLDDLEWLGFEPDLYPPAAFRAGPCESRQSDRHAVYAEAASALAARGLIYGCTCSRRDIAQQSSVVNAPEIPYPGTCRHAGIAPGDGVRWRVRIDPGVETFDDLLMGPGADDPAAQAGDVVIRDARGNWTYQFVASVDDARQSIDLVIRGVDLSASTARQVRLAALVGRRAPARFAHHPLVMKSATEKLSKADRDTSVRDLRRAGWTAARVIGEAAARVGLAPAGGYLFAGDAPLLFG